MLTESGLKDAVEVVGLRRPLDLGPLLPVVLEHVLLEVAWVIVTAVAHITVVQVTRRV